MCGKWMGIAVCALSGIGAWWLFGAAQETHHATHRSTLTPSGSHGPERAEFIKCELTGTVYHNSVDSPELPRGTFISAEGVLWELDLTHVGVAGAALERLNGSRAEVAGMLRDMHVAPGETKRVLVVTRFNPVVMSDKDRRGPRAKPYVRGYIVTRDLAGRRDLEHKRAVYVYLPDVNVYLLDPVTRDVKSRTRTDLNGRFSFPPQPPGTYQLCWRLGGFVPGCLSKPVVVQAKPVFVGEIAISVEAREHHATVYGRVTGSDGRPVRFLEPLSNINAFVRVSALDGQGNVRATAFVNNSGEYVLPQVPTHETVRVRAEIETGSETRSVAREVLSSGTLHRVDIVMSNHAPRLEPMVVMRGGNRVRRTDPGDVVELTAHARDADHDPIRYFWSVPSGAGTLAAPTAHETLWTLPAKPGTFEVSVVASDGKGGYAKSITLLSTRKGVLFSGQVVDSDGAPVATAGVDVNGQSVQTNAAGFFRLTIAESDRFVLNIRKPGFALLSRIYLDGVTAGQWVLSRADVHTVDPTNPIVLIDSRRKRECHVPFSLRAELLRRFPEQRRPRHQDGARRVVRIGNEPVWQAVLEKVMGLRRQRGCGPGIRIEIPANALADADGNPPVGNVDVSLFTVDLLAPFEMPGDYTVAEADGSTRVMESWGAGIVEITAGGNQYNLKDGMTAKVGIPIADVQLVDGRAEPDTIPLLTYDEQRGVWTQVGEARRSGDFYEAKVKHLSAINTDLVKVDQSCVRIHSPQPTPAFPLGLPETYKLEITIPQGAGVAPKVITSTIDNTQPYHVIYNLPSNANIILVPFSVADDVPYGTFVVNTGAPQAPTDPNRPAYPYDACQSEVLLYDVGLPEPPADAFLHGLFTFAATNLDELDPADPNEQQLLQELDDASTNYYNLIDPRGVRQTLAEFIARNGFGGSDEVHAKYSNSADLGFGRDMHAVKRPASDAGFDYGFYVSNYGNHLTPDEEDFQKTVTADPNELVATVCMEYSRIENPPGDPVEFSDPERTIKFYVYNGAGQRVNSANLDGFGARPVPQLCAVCHGGTVPYPGGSIGITDADVPAFSTTEDVKMGAVFLPFDLANFTIVDGVDPAFDKATQQPAFHQLNQFVRESNPGLPIEQIVDQMYPSASTVQVEDFVVPGWAGDAANEAMYRDVIARTCRACHTARPEEVGRDIRFHLFSETVAATAAPAIDFRVCVTKQMPHALIAFNRFWGSRDPAGTSILYPYQPAQLIAWGQTVVSPTFASQCAAQDPPDPPVGVDFGQVQQLFNNNCTFCHSSTGIASFLDLTDGASHGNIVGTSGTSIQLPSMQRIQPGSPDLSYLLHKLKGTHLDVGGSGEQMPLGGPVLPANEIDLVEQWILEGASP